MKTMKILPIILGWKGRSGVKKLSPMVSLIPKTYVVITVSRYIQWLGLHRNFHGAPKYVAVIEFRVNERRQ